MNGEADPESAPSGNGLRVAIATAGEVVPVWQVGTIRHLLASAGVELALWMVIRDGSEEQSGPAASRWWTFYRTHVHRDPEAGFSPTAVSSVVDRVPDLECTSRPAPGAERELDHATVEAIRSTGADLLLDLTPGRLTGAILEALPLGVWTFLHGGSCLIDSDDLGVAEILRCEPTLQASLVRLRPKASPRTLHRGRFRVHGDSLGRTRLAPFRGVQRWPARTCRGFLDGAPEIRRALLSDRHVPHEAEGETGPSSHSQPALNGWDGSGESGAAARVPGAMKMARLLARLSTGYMRRVFREFFRHEQWAVGVVDGPVADVLDGRVFPEPQWLSPGPRGRYLADPFGLEKGGSITVLAEEYDYDERRGSIRALEVGPSATVSDRGRTLPHSVHTSYPYLLELEGDVYCIPETGEARKVVLHRAIRFPDEWEEVATLVEGVAAVDSTIFRHGDRWWLFCADDDGEPNTDLLAWHAEELEGPWIPHSLNPIKSDVRSARPAGTPFRVNGELYRPAQDCSRTYGGAIAVTRIIRLTPTSFRERVVRRLLPDPEGPYPDGLHTLASVGNATLIDGKRDVFVPAAFWKGIRIRLPHAPAD